MLQTMALLILMAIPARAVDFSLKGTWKATSAQLWSCEETAPVPFEDFHFTIEDAPFLNLRSASSFGAGDVTVTGNVSVTTRQYDWLWRLRRGAKDLSAWKFAETLAVRQPPLLLDGFNGKLAGELIRNLKIGNGVHSKTASLGLKGYLTGGSTRWPDGEVELEVSGNAVQGYTLAGTLRSGLTCLESRRMDPAVREMMDRFNHGVPS